MRKAIVDVGSNSILLLVAERRGDDWEPVLETTAVTALGEGTKETGLLGETSMVATLLALKEAFDQASQAGAQDVLARATMAARIARNTDDFLARAAAQGTPVEVLPGEEEARLGLLAVTTDPTFAAQDSVSMIDVGGHSTEIVLARRERDIWHENFRRSFAIGTLGLRGSLLNEESPSFSARLAAAVEVDGHLAPLAEVAPTSDVTVTLGATGTNLASIRDRARDWNPQRVHGAHLSYEEISKAVGWLSGLTDSERSQVPGVEPGRERTIHIGALILERAMHALRVEGCRVSVRGWRHALLHEQ